MAESERVVVEGEVASEESPVYLRTLHAAESPIASLRVSGRDSTILVPSQESQSQAECNDCVQLQVAKKVCASMKSGPSPSGQKRTRLAWLYCFTYCSSR